MPRLLFLFCAACVVAPLAHAQGTVRSTIVEPAFPPLGRPWVFEDINRAAVVLHRMAQEEPAALPHYSVGSRSLFGRLTAPSVLEGAPGSSAEARLAHYSRGVRLYEQILLLYARVHARQGDYDVEVAELSGVLLHATAAMARDLDEIRTRARETPMGAEEASLRESLAGLMNGVLDLIGDPEVLTAGARSRLLLHATRAGGPIAQALTPEGRAAVAARLDALLQRRNLGVPEDDLRSLRAFYADP